MTIKVQLKREVNGVMQQVNPITSDDCVNLQNGKKLSEFVSSIENDEFSPTITQMSSVSKVGVGEDIDISDNTQEGYLKSAILKGCTLVNISSEKTKTFTTSHFLRCKLSHELTNGKKYLLKWEITNNTIGTFEVRFLRTKDGVRSGSFALDVPKVMTATNDGYDALEFFTNANAISQGLTATINDIMVIEYQDGMENWDIPYFEGMQSVKMPVLTTVGKNLFDGELEKGNISSSNGLDTNSNSHMRSKNYINVAPNKVYAFSINTSDIKGLRFYDNNKNFISSSVLSSSFTTPSNCKYIRFIVSTSNPDLEIQIEKNFTSTAYEPYKSNILSTPSDLELRGIGEGSNRVEDELDCLTGEVTERIGEIVLDGSENWVNSDNSLTNTHRFSIALPNFKNSGLLFNDGGFKNITSGTSSDDTKNIQMSGTSLYLRIDRSVADDVFALKDYLSKNNLTIYGELAENSIKTVDLEPSGTNPTTQPYVWKDGHIQLSSEEGSLLPILDYSVTTSRGGQILENTKHIAKQDKRIYDLEMLMINSSVEDAYQRLLLQNDVQVMSRMDETHLNPMRYYMLTRLIEEKMYEETDMLNKLDTFFLYGDISSDQYFELMDKIFGMEEIIEEDFTEEK